jgi:hypothetical protein
VIDGGDPVPAAAQAREGGGHGRVPREALEIEDRGLVAAQAPATAVRAMPPLAGRRRTILARRTIQCRPGAAGCRHWWILRQRGF